MRLYLIITFLFFCFICQNCSPSDKELKKFAKFNAKRSLIKEYCKHHPESLSIYLHTLYKSEKMDSVKIKNFSAYLDKNPEKWIEFQKMVVTQLDSMNPAKSNK